jgi:molybdopterin converting factor subunit 1
MAGLDPDPRMLLAMRVRVLFFGVLRDLMGTPEREMEVAEGATAADVVTTCQGRKAEAAVWGSLAVAVNQEYASWRRVLVDGDEVALLPPVSGGCAAAAKCGGSPLAAPRAAKEV